MATAVKAQAVNPVQPPQSKQVVKVANDGTNAIGPNWRVLYGAREFFSRMMGNFGRREHKLYEVFGWDRRISVQMMWEMYNRGGIAKRVVDAFPQTVWGAPPTWKTGPTAFKDKWQTLIDDQKIWSRIQSADKLCRMGQYSIMVIGTPNGKMDSPITGPVDTISYLQTYSERSARIASWGIDPSKPRFGMPTSYRIYPGMAINESLQPGTTTAMPNQQSFTVHWSRVVHYCKGGMENDVFGIPDLWSIWNYLTDIMKVVGGSAESYWNTANRGLNANVAPEIDLGPEDEANLTAEVEEYFEGQRRFIRTRGVDVKSLGSEVADPTGPYSTLVELVAGTIGMPQRILVGSEAAHQASTQDRQTWAERIDYERELVSEPSFLWPTVAAFQRIGYLPTPKKKPTLCWPDSFILSPLEKQQAANQRATALNNVALAMRNIENLITVEEGRMIAGVNSDDGSAGAIVPGTVPVVPAGNSVVPGHGENAPSTDPGSDGGTAKSGPDSGNTTGAGNTDSNGQGKAPAKRGKR